MNNVADWLPQPPWLGPPLPKFLNVLWPWLQSGEGSLRPRLSTNYISNIEEAGTDLISSQRPITTYENIEEVEFPDGFDPETFMPRKIVIHRKARESK